LVVVGDDLGFPLAAGLLGSISVVVDEVREVAVPWSAWRWTSVIFSLVLLVFTVLFASFLGLDYVFLVEQRERPISLGVVRVGTEAFGDAWTVLLPVD
jgi:hypothetical protein